MKTGIYTVYDSIAKVHSSPIMLLNDDVAIRIMKNCVNNQEHNYSLNPTDYTLYKLGEFDDNTAEITSERTLLVSLLSLVSSRPQLSQVETQ